MLNLEMYGIHKMIIFCRSTESTEKTTVARVESLIWFQWIRSPQGSSCKYRH